jgi:WD40 repeat protein
MFRVEWLQSALDELATIWTQADSAERQAITRATHLIDQQLQQDPDNQGESRPKGRRVLFAPPWVTVCLSVVSLGLGPLSPLSAQEPKLRDTLKGHTTVVFSVAYSPDGKTLASGNSDGKIKLWDVATGKERATLNGHRDFVLSVVFSPDAKMLASGGEDGTTKLWDVATNKERATLL